MPICDTHAMVKLGLPVKEYVELLTQAGLPHHVIVGRGDVRRQLVRMADLMGMTKTVI